MTANKTIFKKRGSFSRFAGTLALCFLILLFFKNSQVASEQIRHALYLCYSTVIPSIFPFMVLSELTVSSGLVTVIGKRLRHPMSLLFGISGDGACALFLGLLCGFPIGARCAVSLYERGSISRSECERLLSFCNIPSMSFTVNVVGQSLFGSLSAGWILYAISAAAALIFGTISKLISKKSPSYSKTTLFNRHERIRPSSFVRAIENSARSTLTVCAYVVFFSSLVGVLNVILTSLGSPELLKTLLCGTLEMTNGVLHCSSLSSPIICGAVCAFFVGWSGISVHFQLFSICEGKDLRLGGYIAGKLFQGIFCSAAALLLFSK